MKRARIILFQVQIFIILNSGYAGSLENYQFISPRPGSEFNKRESTIIIRYGEEIDPSSLLSAGIIQVNGSKSGEKR